MSGWRSIERRGLMSMSARRIWGVAAAIAAAVTLTACGGGQRQDVNEPRANFTVDVPTASFPATQTLSQHTHMTIVVRNLGNQPIPNVAVTICNVSCAYNAPPGEGTSAQAFSENLNQENLANPSRPVWIVDQPPGLCGYSCKEGGPGGAVTVYANTWALGRLQPGKTATFKWAVTAVKPGTHVVAWQVAAGLNGKAKAYLPDGAPPQGTFTVTIGQTPQKSYVNDAGQVVVQKP